MEALTALPAELVAVADPTARGAAPLLRPAKPDGDSPAVPASFEACLALLAMPLPAGEALPVAGKDLPAPLASAAAAPQPPPAADALAAEGDAAALAQLKLTAAVATADPVELSAPPATPAMPASGGGPAQAAAAFVAEVPTGSAPTVLPAPDPAALEPTETSAAPAVPAESAELPTGLEALAAPAEHAPRARKDADAARRPVLPYAAGAAPPPAGAAQPVTDAVGDARNAVRHADLPEISAASAVTPAEAPSTSRADWLPSAPGNASSGQASAAPAQVDVRTPDWQEAFANRVQVLVDHDVGEARITLHPPELGAVDIEISLVDDKTFVQMTTSTAAARDELAQSLPRLRELLSGGGLTLGGASVHDGRGGERAPYGSEAANALQRSLAPLAELAGFGADAPASLAARPRGRIDVFA